MAESVADDILRSGYERWRRLEEEKEAIGSDLKELMAELKGQGFTPKALRESFRRVRNAGDAAIEEHDALVDLYVESLTRGTRERAREIIEEFPADEPNHDPLTGEIIEPEPMVAQAGEAVPGATSVQPPVRDGLSATKSTDASQERAQTATGVGTGGDNLGPASRSSAPAKTEAPTDQSQASGDGQSQHNGGVRVAPVDTHPHPACKRPTLCGGYSNLALCQACKEAAGIVAVVPGGVEIDHHGQVH